MSISIYGNANDTELVTTKTRGGFLRNLSQTSATGTGLTYPIPPLTAPSTSTTRVTPQKRYLAMG